MRHCNWVPVFLATLAIVPAVSGRSRRDRGVSTTPGAFDYYLLSLSWAPTWCGLDASRSNSAECAPGKHIGFIVHGFWPESAAGKNPENCGAPGRVSNSSLKVALPLMLSANLIQHEWATHGTCSGLNQYDYFTAIAQVRGSVQIPVQLNSAGADISKSPSDIESQFGSANSGYPKDAFRVACTRGKLEEVRICFDKNLKPRSCTANVADCNESRVTIPATL